MDFKIARFSTSIVLAILLSSCVPTATLTRHMNQQRSSLAYIQESQVFTSPKKYSIKVEKTTISQGLTDNGKAYSLKTVAVPLIVFTYWQQQLEYRLGRQQITDDISDFTMQATISEMNRSASFSADSISAPGSQLKLVMDFDKMEARGPYKTEGFMLMAGPFAVYHNRQAAGPASATTSIRYKLIDGENVVLDKAVSSIADIKPIALRVSPFSEFRKGYSANLSEQVSLSIRTNISKIIKDIEIFLLTYQPTQVTGSVTDLKEDPAHN
jgi:hypothetical protein